MVHIGGFLKMQNRIRRHSDDYYDLNELRFQVKVRLTDPAGGYQGLKANLADSDANNSRNTYCVNNFGHTIFRDIDMR